MVLPHAPISLVANELPGRYPSCRVVGRGVWLQRFSCYSSIFCCAPGELAGTHIIEALALVTRHVVACPAGVNVQSLS